MAITKVPRFSKVGGDEFHGSHAVVEPMLVPYGCVSIVGQFSR